MNTNATNATDYIRRLTAHIDPFLDGFRAAGYAPAAVTSRRLIIINAFIRSIASKRRSDQGSERRRCHRLLRTPTDATRGS